MNLRLLFSALIIGCVVAALVTSPTFAASMGPSGGGGGPPACRLSGGANCTMLGPIILPAGSEVAPSTQFSGFAAGLWADFVNGGIGLASPLDIYLDAQRSVRIRSNGAGNASLQAKGTGDTNITTISGVVNISPGEGATEVTVSSTQITSVLPLVIAEPVQFSGGVSPYVGTAPSSLPTCDSTRRGMLGYREDTDTTANNPAVCMCTRDTGALTYSWKVLSGTGTCL